MPSWLKYKETFLSQAVLWILDCPLSRCLQLRVGEQVRLLFSCAAFKQREHIVLLTAAPTPLVDDKKQATRFHALAG